MARLRELASRAAARVKQVASLKAAGAPMFNQSRPSSLERRRDSKRPLAHVSIDGWVA